MSNFAPPVIHGILFGFDIKRRSKVIDGTDSPTIHLCIEDDGWWYRKDVSFDAYWIDDMLSTLQRLKAHLS